MSQADPQTYHPAPTQVYESARLSRVLPSHVYRCRWRDVGTRGGKVQRKQSPDGGNSGIPGCWYVSCYYVFQLGSHSGVGFYIGLLKLSVWMTRKMVYGRAPSYVV